jgi:hypothetical protein
MSNWGTLDITTDAAFYGCTNLDVSATDAPIISSLTLNRCFRQCSSLTTPDFYNWDVSGVQIFASYVSAMYQLQRKRINMGCQ